MFMTRRAMIRDGLLAVSAGMIMPSVFARAVRAASNAAEEGSKWAQASQNKTLIVVQMAGGNDGLNTVVPYTDGTYYQARPNLAVPAASVLQLNDRLGFHPALKPLMPLWQNKKLAIVEGVGYQHPSLSHFQAMDIWQTVDLSGQGTQGWLGKYVAGLVDKDGHPFQSLAIGTTLPTALQALNAEVPVLSSPQQYQLQPDAAAKPTAADQPADPRLQALLKLYNTYPDSAPYAALLRPTASALVDGARQLAQTTQQYTPKAEYDAKDPFAQGLKVLAEVIVNDLGLRVGYVTLGGFDTHAGQQARQRDLLTRLASGLTAFYDDLEGHGKADNVTIMTWSEFGRRVHENASLGTDHGTAAPLFVLGNAVNGGLYGEPPDLGALDNYGNLNFIVDFRSVYATVLTWLGAPAAAVLGQSFSSQGFLPAGD